jgi:hypothetical protein
MRFLEVVMVTLNDLIDGDPFGSLADMGPADANLEGAYRRGYHQCAAAFLRMLEAGHKPTAENLSEWVEKDGAKWRHEMPLGRQIHPPHLPCD